MTALLTAAQRGRTTVIPLLLWHGASADVYTKKSKTAVELAREYGGDEAVTMLENADKYIAEAKTASGVVSAFQHPSKFQCHATPTEPASGSGPPGLARQASTGAAGAKAARGQPASPATKAATKGGQATTAASLPPRSPSKKALAAAAKQPKQVQEPSPKLAAPAATASAAGRYSSSPAGGQA